MPDTVSHSVPFLAEHTLADIVDSLVEHGWYCGNDVIDISLCAALKEEVNALRHQNALDQAGIGRGHQHHQRRDIRGDAIHWLDRATPDQKAYLASMEALQQTLNQQLYLGLFEYEAHFAHYPPGAHYACHLDSFQGRSNRVISTVGYLNPDWQPGDGGEMVIYAPDAPGQALARVEPRAGTFTCFLSERMPHEVLPTRVPRTSIAGWFRRNASLGAVIDPPR